MRSVGQHPLLPYTDAAAENGRGKVVSKTSDLSESLTLGSGAIDFIGDSLPKGYMPWSCATCTAVCNFEAMVLCLNHPNCRFAVERPESNGGHFGFIIRCQT